jgi:hypothetical protein
MQELLDATGTVNHEEFCLVRRDNAASLQIGRHAIQSLA